MKIMILGLGVIGTTYAYAFQKAGFETEHLIREQKRDACPKEISVKLLDGRRMPKREDVCDTYTVRLAQPDSLYDLILVSVSGDRLKEAVQTLNSNRISGTIFVCNGVKEGRSELDAILQGRKYLLGYPVAGGQLDMENARMDCVLFDHVMLEREEKAAVDNYADIVSLFENAGIKTECPHDMLEWIWLHMAINAGVITAAATAGSIADSAAAARVLMGSASALRRAILVIRECVKIVEARGVDLRNYKTDLLPYRLPAALSGYIMKQMFKTNRLTRKIMELHANKDDLLYVCGSVYEEGRRLDVPAPRFYENYESALRVLGE